MRVLLISHTCQSPTEGQPKTEWLARMGVDMHVVVPRRWKMYGQWLNPTITSNPQATYHVSDIVWPWAGPAQNYLHWYPAMPRLIKELKPDIIDLWEEPWGLGSALTCWWRDRLSPGTRIISETEQNIDKKLPLPFERFRRYSLTRADYAVARSQGALEVLRRKKYEGPASVVPNAVDADLFQPGQRDATRQSLGWTGFVIGYVGRWVEEKGLEEAVHALADCPPHVRLALIGFGPLRDTLETLAASLHVADRLTFLPARPQAEVPPLMSALDALILPSRTTARWKEQFGRVLIEAMACQVPVIGARSGAIPDVVGDTGLLVPEQDPPRLALAMRRLAADSGLCYRLGQEGRARVLREYTWERVAEQMKSIYDGLMKNPPTGPDTEVQNTSQE